MLIISYLQTAPANGQFTGSRQQLIMPACMQEACQNSPSFTSFQQYLELEKTQHPQLDETFKLFESDIELLRKSREARVRSAIEKLKQTSLVQREIDDLTKVELLSMLFNTVRPFNEVRKVVGSEIVVKAEPTISSSERQKYSFIENLYNRIMAESPLEKAAVEFRILGKDPRQTFHLSQTQSLMEFVDSYLEKRIEEFPNFAPALRREFEETKVRFSGMQRLVSPTQFAMFFAEFETTILIQSQKISLTESEQILARQIISERVAEVSGQALLQESKLSQAYLPEEWEGTCRESLNRALHYGLNSAEIIQFDRMKEEALQRASLTIRSIFPVNLSNKLQIYLTSVSILGPMSLESYFDSMKFQLAYNSRMNALEDYGLDDLYKITYELNREKDFALDTLCNKRMYEPVLDQEQDGQVILSAYTARHTVTGLTIALHEIGHAVTSGLRELESAGEDITGFHQMRSCLNTNYRDANQNGRRFPSDKLWTEEDWADAFASRSLRDKQSIGYCPFLGAKPGNDYAALSQRGEAPHSPAFYRILNQWVHQKGELPAVCSAALVTEHAGAELRDCLR